MFDRIYRLWQRSVVMKFFAPALKRAKNSKKLNQYDRELLFALERIFIAPPPQIDDPEDEFDFVLIRMLLMFVLIVTVLKILVVLFGLGSSSVFNPIYGIFVATFFFALFHMLYHEMKETGVFTMYIATTTLIFGMLSSF